MVSLPRLGVLAAFIFSASLLCAQDPFEIHVYEYETLKPGQFTLEQHLNYVGRGTRTYEGTVAPTNNQLHMTYELTAGVTDQFSIGAMQLNALRTGGDGLEYAGWRVLPHLYVPRSWGWPVDFGLVTEFSFQNTAYEENSRRVEVRPILEKSFGALQIDFNPVFERALHGPGTRRGWNFEPAARIGYEAGRRFTPSLEYYSSLGPVRRFSPGDEQIHLFYPGADIHVTEHILWSLGVGVAATPAGSQLIYKSRIEIEFGKGKH
jgi:hypothetical protein